MTPETVQRVIRAMAKTSPNRKRKVAAAITTPSGRLLSYGINKFVDGVQNTPERHEHPLKDEMFQHAERMAISTAAREGVPTAGCHIHVNWFPCPTCANCIVDAGIVTLHCPEPDWKDPKWGPRFVVARVILVEAGVEIDFVPGPKDPLGTV